MEILALLLLGLIAMLAIVPPIIRGKLDESPLASTQSFQRSMQEMANSIEPRSGREETPYRARVINGSVTPIRQGYPDRPHMVPSPMASRRKAAVKRNRITLGLMVFAAIWGIATLISGRTWCMVLFTIACGLMVIYWGLVLIMPGILQRSRAASRAEEARRYRHSQAL
ncbi:MAG: hypothetical protein AB1384_06835 [Actinomycetota bacterium]